MAIFNKEYIAENKVKYDDKIKERAADIYRKIQNNLNNNHLFTLYPIRKDQISFTKKDNDIISHYIIGKVNKNEFNKDDIRKIITSARYIINDEVKKCRVSIYDQIDGLIYSSITFYNSANKYILSETYKSNTYIYKNSENTIDKSVGNNIYYYKYTKNNKVIDEYYYFKDIDINDVILLFNKLDKLSSNNIIKEKQLEDLYNTSKRNINDFKSNIKNKNIPINSINYFLVSFSKNDKYINLTVKTDSNTKFSKEYKINQNINEASYKYSWQDDDEDEMDKPAKLIKHLSNTEIRRARDIIKSTISKYPRIKKCCDYIDLYDTEEFDDDGNRSSALERYKKRKGSAYFRLVEGDVFSGYPNFRGEGSEDFADDVEDLKKDINEKFKQLNFPAEFVVKNDDEAINFGVVSKKS